MSTWLRLGVCSKFLPPILFNIHADQNAHVIPYWHTVAVT